MKRHVSSALLTAVATLLLAPSSWATLAPYSQNFEALSAANSSALSGAGFLVSGLVFDGNSGTSPPYGVYKFFYGNNPAPNGGSAFSAIASGAGGAPQGTKYLNVYSDYNCCASGSQGHLDPSAPFDYVQSNVFQQQTIGVADIGRTWTLTFDARLPAASGCEPTTTSDCIAFIRTQDPNAGFATTYRATFDAQTLSNTAWSTHVLSFVISDPALNGHILQFGFMSTSRQYGNTSVYYDNIKFAVDPNSVADADADGIPDASDNCPVTANPTQDNTDGDARGNACDNCTLVANTDPGVVPGTTMPKAQLDADQDGYGNACDGDLNNSNLTTATDNTVLRNVLNQAYGASATAARADMNGSGLVTATDNTLLRNRLNTAPGPSGLACAGTIPCASPASFTLRPLPSIYTTGKAVDYSAFRAGGPGVGEVPSDAAVLQDLGLLHDAGFNLLRLFGADTVSEKILRLAAANFPEMKFQQGIYLRGPTPVSCDDAVNSAQIAKAILLASQNANVVTVSVGNETSLGSGLTVACLESYVQTVRNQVAQPVTADDGYDFYKGSFASYKPDNVLAMIDFVAIHMYPIISYSQWNWQQTGTPAGPARAAAMMNAALAEAQRNYADVYNYSYRNAAGSTVSIGASLPIVVGETGWKAVPTNPSSVIETYTANPVNAKWYYDLLASWEGSAGGPVTIFYFEAFDEAWKGTDDGWGLWDKDRFPRYGLCGTPAGAPCNANLYQGAGYYPF